MKFPTSFYDKSDVGCPIYNLVDWSNITPNIKINWDGTVVGRYSARIDGKWHEVWADENGTIVSQI
jgi:hypothetical protein